MNTATSDQLGRIEHFLADHKLFSNHYDRLWAQLEAARIDLRNQGDGTPITSKRADQIFAWLERHHAGCKDCQTKGFCNLKPSASRQVGCQHRADRNGNCHTCGAEMFDPSLRPSRQPAFA